MKADEEFAIEKVRPHIASFCVATSYTIGRMQAKLVKSEQQAIDTLYEKKTKGAVTQQKMQVTLPPPSSSPFHLRPIARNPRSQTSPD